MKEKEKAKEEPVNDAEKRPDARTDRSGVLRAWSQKVKEEGREGEQAKEAASPSHRKARTATVPAPVPEEDRGQVPD